MPLNDQRRELDFSLQELIQLFASRWRFLFVVALTAAISAAIYAFFLREPHYLASASLLPGRSDILQRGVPILERGAFNGAFSVRNVTTRNSMNLEMMVSDVLRRSIVDSLGLVEFFGHEREAAADPERGRLRAVESLIKATHFELSMQLQVLVVHVSTRDAEMSARIANAYLAEVARLGGERYRRFAREKMAFIDRRLDELKPILADAEDDLLAFQGERSLLDPDLERGGLFALRSRLQTRLLENEIVIARLEQDFTESAPQLRSLEAETKILGQMLNALEGKGGQPAFDKSLSNSGDPAVAVEWRRLSHELKLLESLQLMLIEEHEMARLQSELDFETITELDHARPAVDPVGPSRKLIVLSAAICAMVAAAALLLLTAFLARLGNGSPRAGLRALLEES